MILADKILSLRKNSGWSQEELAEKLNVSRQSVSKWESALSIPDIGKIVDMAKLFGVSTDYLLKDDMEQPSYTEGEADGARRVDISEASAYIEDRRAAAKKQALGVLLCILSPVLLIVLPLLMAAIKGLVTGEAAVDIPEALAIGIGIVVMLLMVASAVMLFITSSSGTRKYRFLERGEFELAYGVAGILRERWSALEPRYTASIAIGVALCILSPIPLIVSAIAGASDLTAVLFTGLMFIIVAAAVYSFIRACSEKGSYDRLLREGDYDEKEADGGKRANKLGGIYWPTATAIYLAWSFISGNWHMTWIVWPVAGVLFGAVCAIARAVGPGRK